MSRNTPHLCAHPGCPAILEHGPGRCPEHRGKPRPGTPGYGARWRRLRTAYAREHPHCETPGCGKPVADVDHIDGARPGDPTFYDWTNLQSLCRSCHRRKTEYSKRTRSAA
jgi:5-methylcytosine-specific restriction enzyme A